VTASLLATLMGGLAFLPLTMIFAGLVHREWFRVPEPRRYRPSLGILLACWIALIALYAGYPDWAIGLAVGGGVAGIALALVRGHSLYMSVGGYLYILLPSMVLLHMRQYGVEPVILLFIVVWITDTGAFAVGKTLGGPKLWPAVSPNKTWSGVIGGAVIGALAGGIAAWLYGLDASIVLQVVWISLVISVAGQLGDLGESAWKRHFNVKDTGGIIPGHGGVMDRLDSLIVAAPVLAILQLTGGA